jgi:GWxTD domain-containing protein
MARRAAFAFAFAAALAALSCAGLAPGRSAAPFAALVQADAGLDAAGRPVLRLEVSVPYSELIFERNRLGYFETRLLTTVTARDERGKQVGGNAWPDLVQVETYAQTRAADREFQKQVELPLPPGRYEVEAGVQVKGTGRRAMRRLAIDIPAPDPEALWIEAPQFWQRQARRAAAGDSLVRNVHRTYGRGAGDPHVRCLLHDARADTSAGPYTVRAAVHDEEGREVLQFETRVQPTGARTQVEFDLPVQALLLGTYRLDVEARQGERSARAEAGFEIGFAALAWAGDLAETLAMLEAVLPAAEIDSLRHAPPAAREQSWRALWARHDPDPATPANEFMDRLFERVRFANAHFSVREAGWRTARGRVYLELGPPDEVLVLPGPEAGGEMQRWTYWDENQVFLFLDAAGDGDYTLYRTNARLD